MAISSSSNCRYCARPGRRCVSTWIHVFKGAGRVTASYHIQCLNAVSKGSSEPEHTLQWFGTGRGRGVITDSEYIVAAFRLPMRRSAATISKNVGRAEPSPPSDTKDIAEPLSLLDVYHIGGLFPARTFSLSTSSWVTEACYCWAALSSADGTEVTSPVPVLLMRLTSPAWQGPGLKPSLYSPALHNTTHTLTAQLHPYCVTLDSNALPIEELPHCNQRARRPCCRNGWQCQPSACTCFSRDCRLHAIKVQMLAHSCWTTAASAAALSCCASVCTTDCLLLGGIQNLPCVVPEEAAKVFTLVSSLIDSLHIIFGLNSVKAACGGLTASSLSQAF